MTAPVPTIEPTRLHAGDTWTWKRTLGNYPAGGGWTLLYVFANGSHRFTVTAAADGDDHLVEEAKTTTDDRVPGIYTWTAFAKSSTERFKIGAGQVEILPNLEGDRPFDLRSTARQIYDALVALQLANASGQGLVAEYSIAGRSMRFRDSADLLKQIAFWKSQVDAEEAADRLNRGEPTGRRLLARF